MKQSRSRKEDLQIDPGYGNLDRMEFSLNPERRCPAILLLDTSGSMSGSPIEALNAGMIEFKSCLEADSLARKRVELAVIGVGGEEPYIVSQFTSIDKFSPVPLHAYGSTPLGAGIELGWDLAESRVQRYKQNGVGYYAPQMFLISDGAATDSTAAAASRTKKLHSRQWVLHSIAVNAAALTELKNITVNEPIELKNLKFAELFRWISGSLSNGAASNNGQTSLPPTGAWAVSA